VTTIGVKTNWLCSFIFPVNEAVCLVCVCIIVFIVNCMAENFSTACFVLYEDAISHVLKRALESNFLCKPIIISKPHIVDGFYLIR